MMRTAGFGPGSALSFLLTLSLGAIFGGAVGSALADRLGNKRVVGIGFAGAAVSMALISLDPPTVALLLLIAIAGATTLGTQIVLFGYAGAHFPAEIRAKSLGFTSGIGRLGAIAGPVLGGILVGRDVGSTWSFGIFGIFAAVALAGALLVSVAPGSVRPGIAGTIARTRTMSG